MSVRTLPQISSGALPGLHGPALEGSALLWLEFASVTSGLSWASSETLSSLSPAEFGTGQSLFEAPHSHELPGRALRGSMWV